MKNIARFVSVAATVCGLSLWAQDDLEEDETSETTAETTAGEGEEADVGIDIDDRVFIYTEEPIDA